MTAGIFEDMLYQSPSDWWSIIGGIAIVLIFFLGNQK